MHKVILQRVRPKRYASTGYKNIIRFTSLSAAQLDVYVERVTECAANGDNPPSASVWQSQTHQAVFKVDVRDTKTDCFINACTRSVEKEKKRPNGHRIKNRRTFDSHQKPKQLCLRKDVGAKGRGQSGSRAWHGYARNFISCLPKLEEGSNNLVFAPPRIRGHARPIEVYGYLPGCDLMKRAISHRAQDRLQSPLSSGETNSSQTLPCRILEDCLGKSQRAPTKSRAATSRRVLMSTRAYTLTF